MTFLCHRVIILVIGLILNASQISLASNPYENNHVKNQVKSESLWERIGRMVPTFSTFGGSYYESTLSSTSSTAPITSIPRPSTSSTLGMNGNHGDIESMDTIKRIWMSAMDTFIHQGYPSSEFLQCKLHLNTSLFKTYRCSSPKLHSVTFSQLKQLRKALIRASLPSVIDMDIFIKNKLNNGYSIAQEMDLDKSELNEISTFRVMISWNPFKNNNQTLTTYEIETEILNLDFHQFHK